MTVLFTGSQSHLAPFFIGREMQTCLGMFLEAEVFS